MDVSRKVLALLAVRDAQDTLERAGGWTVHVRHQDAPGDVGTLYGPFTFPAAALAWAADFEQGLNTEGETGFRCVVIPVMPAHGEEDHGNVY